MKRTLSLILALLLLFASCGTAGTETAPAEAPADTAAEKPAEPAAETETEPPETALRDSLPERDFGGADYVILSAVEQWQNMYVAEDLTGDGLNDAVYNRNTAVGERFGVNLRYDVINGYTAGIGNVTEKLRESVQAGDAAYDLFIASCAYTSPQVTEGLLRNMSDLEYLDYGAPWYFHETNEQLSVKGKLYTAAGAFGFNTIAQCSCIFFNKELMNDIGETYPYQAVLDGEWTYDRMLATARKALEDTNGDGIYDKNDRFGILSTKNESVQLLGFGMGYRIIEKNEDGIPVYRGAPESTVDIMETLSKLINEENCYHAAPEVDPLTEMVPMFTAGKGLFAVYMLNLMHNEAMREAPDFGILPMPKKDEAQEKYCSSAFADVAAFPIVCRDMEMGQIVLEALNSESYVNVIPRYYDVILQRKLARDEDSSAMIDLIYDGSFCDFGMAFFRSLDRSLYAFDEIIGSFSFTKWWTAHEKLLQSKLNTLLEQLAAVEA